MQRNAEDNYVETVKKKKKITKSLVKDILFYASILAWPVFQFSIMWLGVNINQIALAFKGYVLVDKEQMLFDYEIVWFQNFKNVFSDLVGDGGILLIALKNSMLMYFMNLLICMPLSILISYYIFKKFPGAGAFKVILHIPSFISALVLALIFKIIADRGYTELMYRLTGVEKVGLFARSDAYPTLVLYTLYWGLATNILMYVGGMGSIDESLFEAAKLDGAGTMQEFLHIILPGIYPTLQTFLITGAAGILTAGPGLFEFYDVYAPKEYWTFGYYLTRGIRMIKNDLAEYPYYSAFSIMLTLVAVPIVFGMRKLTDKLDPMREV